MLRTTIGRTVTISEETYQSIKEFISDTGDRQGEGISSLIEKAVRDYLFDRTVKEIRAAFSDMTTEEITELVDEAVDWARSQ